MVDLSDLLPLFNAEPSAQSSLRQLQLPDYTSPPLPVAIENTPELFRNDTYLDHVRGMIDADGTCNDDVPYFKIFLLNF